MRGIQNENISNLPQSNSHHRIVALYARVSTDEQAREGQSIDTQLDKLTAYARFQGWNCVETFVDEGASAKDMNRPAMKRLLSLIKEGKVAVVATMAIDRLSRNLLDMLNFIELCEQHGTAYVCTSLNFDTSTPIGRMVLQILAAFAEFERAMIATRVKTNMAEIVSKKKKYMAVPPFGYRFDDERNLVEVPEEAEWVRRAADLFIAGYGYRAISKILNEAGVRTRKGKAWSGPTVRAMLTNELYAGKVIWNRRYYDKNGKMRWRNPEDWIVCDNAHEPILSRAQWDQIQARLTRKMPKGGEKQMKYRISGLVICGHCGSKMVSRRYGNKGPNKDRLIFVCSQYQKSGGCWFNYIFIDEAEKTVYEALQDLVAGMMYISSSDLEKASKALLEDLARREAAIDQKFQRQIQAYENGIISDNDLRLARERVERERKALERERAEILSRIHQEEQVDQHIGSGAKELLWLWNNGNARMMQNVLRTIINGTIVKDRAIADIRLSETLFRPISPENSRDCL
ncbi:MAG TPA: recombinase family protein [Firmicutes bacterium]|nr:recombinase family protein [Candidatus Fermentithermobacillaceae bacterium]